MQLTLSICGSKVLVWDLCTGACILMCLNASRQTSCMHTQTLKPLAHTLVAPHLNHEWPGSWQVHVLTLVPLRSPAMLLQRAAAALFGRQGPDSCRRGSVRCLGSLSPGSPQPPRPQRPSSSGLRIDGDVHLHIASINIHLADGQVMTPGKQQDAIAEALASVLGPSPSPDLPATVARGQQHQGAATTCALQQPDPSLRSPPPFSCVTTLDTRPCYFLSISNGGQYMSVARYPDKWEADSTWPYPLVQAWDLSKGADQQMTCLKEDPSVVDVVCVRPGSSECLILNRTLQPLVWDMASDIFQVCATGIELLDEYECEEIMDDVYEMAWFAATVSCNGRYAGILGERGALGVFDLDTKECVSAACFRELRSGVCTFRAAPAISDDGRRLTAVNQQGEVWVWDVDSGAINCQARLLSEEKWDDDGGRDEGGRKAGQGEEKPYPLSGLVLSADGRRAVSMCGKEVLVWDLHTGACTGKLGHTGDVCSVAICGDGRRLVTGDSHALVRVWEVESGRCVAELKGHTSVVDELAISSEGQHAASAGCEGCVRVWYLGP